MSSESGRRRPPRLAATGLVPLVLLASLGCGLKGDPLPPIRPPEPAAEEVSAETEDPTEDSAEGEDEENAESEDEDPDADDSDGADGEPEAEDGDGEEDGSGAKGPA